MKMVKHGTKMLLRSMRQNVTAGVQVGLMMAVLLCLWVAILALIQRSITFKTTSGASFNAFVAMGLYLFGGLSGGAMVGALQPMMRWRIGAAIVGILAALPFCTAVIAMLSGFSVWGRTESISLVLFVITCGGSGGLIMHKLMRE